MLYYICYNVILRFNRYKGLLDGLIRLVVQSARRLIQEQQAARRLAPQQCPGQAHELQLAHRIVAAALFHLTEALIEDLFS